MPVSIHVLADHPEHLETLMKWSYDLWDSHREGWTMDTIRRYAKPFLRNRTKLPLALVAIEGDQVLGSIDIVKKDFIADDVSYSPWIADLIVTPDCKNRSKIGLMLAEAACEKARNLGFTEIYFCRKTNKARDAKKIGQTYDLGVKYNIFRKVL